MWTYKGTVHIVHTSGRGEGLKRGPKIAYSQRNVDAMGWTEVSKKGQKFAYVL